jgi:hypothetical protein
MSFPTGGCSPRYNADGLSTIGMRNNKQSTLEEYPTVINLLSNWVIRSSKVAETIINTVTASSKEAPCFLEFSLAFLGPFKPHRVALNHLDGFYRMNPACLPAP